MIISALLLDNALQNEYNTYTLLLEHRRKEREITMRQYGKLLAWLLTVALLVCCTACGDRKQAEVSVPSQADLTTSDENTQATISAPKEPEVEPEPEKVSISGDIRVGETLIFGSYEQDNNSNNGKEPVEWIVLAKENNRILVISRYGLLQQETSSIWEKSGIRLWLNGGFYIVTFSEAEQATILTTTVEASRNSKHWKVDSGASTQDKLFLLSEQEAKEYFSDDNSRRCFLTQSTIANSQYISEYIGREYVGSWWLRTPGISGNSIECVSDTGEIHHDGYAYFSTCAVRPAMWLEIDA